MIKNENILVVVSHGLRMPWTKILYEGQCKTWLGEDINSEVKILHIYGDAPSRFYREFEKINEIIRLNIPKSDFIRKIYLYFPYMYYKNKSLKTKIEKLNLTNMSALKVDILDISPFVIFKLIATFRWFIKNTNYDFIYITTTSSYLRIDKLVDFMNTQQNLADCNGTIMRHFNIIFPSGANRLFSRKVISEVLKNINQIDFLLPEDVALGKLITELNYNIFNLPTVNIDSKKRLQSLTNKEIQENFHFRVKSMDKESFFNPVNASYHENAKRNDVELMQLLHKRIQSQQQNS